MAHGWLQKRGPPWEGIDVRTRDVPVLASRRACSYQRRYFLLHGAMMSYFESPEAASAAKAAKGSPIVGRIAHVRPSQVSELSAERASLAFSFESIEGKNFIVYADTPEQKLGWLHALGKALGGGHGAARLTVEKAFASQILAGEAATEGSASSRASASSPGSPGSPGTDRAGGAGSSVDAAWALVAQGARQMQDGTIDQARVLLSRAIDRSDGSLSSVAVAAHGLLGKMLVSKQMYREAAEHYSAAAEGAPDSCVQHVRLQLAWCLWHSGRAGDAEAVYWEVLDNDVLCWQALVDRARMHLSRGSWGQALCDLAQVTWLRALAAQRAHSGLTPV